MSKYNGNKRNIKAIILAGGQDFGRCPVASRVPAALWPVIDKPAIERLLLHLSGCGVKQAVICSNGSGVMVQNAVDISHYDMNVKFLDEQMPAGTAGCIRNAACDETDALLIVFPASIVNPPAIDTLIQAHCDSKADLTVVFNPSCREGELVGESSGIYICETSILEHIPKDGYFDIKEGLVPEMLRAGKTVHTVTLPSHAGNFRDRQEYLFAIANYIGNTPKPSTDLKLCKQTDSGAVWAASSSKIDPNVRIYGPVVVMDGACISKDAVIFGPTIIGRNVNVGRDSLIVDSVLWDGAQVGANCEIQRCIIDYKAVVRANKIVEDMSIPFKPKGIVVSLFSSASEIAKDCVSKLQSALQPQLERINEKMPDWLQSRRANIVHWLAAAIIVVIFLWSYWSGIIDLWRIWQQSDEYSSGLLVPFLAVYILWSRREQITSCRLSPSLWGLLAFLMAQAIRLFGLFFMYSSAERLSIVLSVAALVLLLCGWELFSKVFTTIVFLGLMLPLPRSIHYAVMLPLQSWSTSSAVFCLEMLGCDVIREGNVIHLGGTSVAVAEACNGLRMVMAFFVIAGLVVLLVRRTWWEKLIVFVSALPIALLCNTVRLTITAIAFTELKGEYWEKMFHDFGGYAMMPLALGLIVLELWFLTKITTVPAEEQVALVDK